MSISQKVFPPVRQTAAQQQQGEVIYSQGPISGIPEDHASRRDRFAELDTFQQGWTVELRQRNESGIVDAFFYSPEGKFHKSYADARRAALQNRTTSE